MQKEQCYAAMPRIIVQRRRGVATGEEEKRVMRAKRGRQETDDPLLTPWELGELGAWELGCRCMLQGAGCGAGCGAGRRAARGGAPRLLQRLGKGTCSSPAP